VDSSVAGKSCLDEKTALRLATLGIQLEKKFGSPRDIEFAIKQVAY
jgi:phosphoenolpyruvate synthase/pyruvate phosphate dikinase